MSVLKEDSTTCFAIGHSVRRLSPMEEPTAKNASFFAELKRRNVYRLAVAYGVVAWLLVQGGSIFFPTFDAPPWVMKVLIAGVLLGFPAVLIVAWAFEITPEGLKRAEDVPLDKSITRRTGRKLDFVIALLRRTVLEMRPFSRH